MRRRYELRLDRAGYRRGGIRALPGHVRGLRARLSRARRTDGKRSAASCSGISGRLLYVFLGTLAGFFGHWFSGIAILSRILTFAAGTLLILAGAYMLNLLPWPRKAPPAGTQNGAEGILPSVFRRFLLQPTAGGALALGLATGFLPADRSAVPHIVVIPGWGLEWLRWPHSDSAQRGSLLLLAMFQDT